MKDTIGECNICYASPRFLKIETDNYGDMTVGICHYGCSNEQSIASDPELLIQNMLDERLKELKRKIRESKNHSEKVPESLDSLSTQLLKLLKYRGFSKAGFTDWSYVLGVAIDRKKTIEREIKEKEASRQTKNKGVLLTELERKKLVYYELYRYACNKIK